MGEYTKLKGVVGHPPKNKETAHDAKVREIKEQLKEVSAAKLGQQYCELRAKKEALEAEIKTLTADIEARSDLLVSWMEASGISKLGIDGADRTLYIKDNLYSTVDDKAKFHAYLYEAGLAEAMFSVHYMTLNSFVDSRLKNGENAPPGVSYYVDSKITWR